MPWFDLPLDQLRDYRTGTAEPPDLDLWWRRRLDEARATVRPPVLTRYETEIYAPVEVFDTEFSGADGDRIRAWYLRPPGADGQTQVVVKFIGYGGGRGMPAEHALLPALGYAVFVMDTRGQGGRWTTGATGDRHGDPAAGPENARVMTRGIARPEGYYYTRLFTDAVLAVEAASELTGAPRVAVSGASQGGGLALAVAGLLSWTRPLATVGLLLYCAGVLVFLDPFVRTARRRAPHGAATVLLAAGTGWLLAGLGYDVVALFRAADPYALAADVGDLAPWLLTGFAVQILIGALSVLVPVVLGGSPSVNRRTAAALNRLGPATAALLNAGVLLLALPDSALSRAAWPLVAAAIVLFAASVAAAVVARAGARPAG